MIEDFFKLEKEAIDKELETYFEILDKNEKDVLLGDFISQLKTFILNKKAKRIHPVLLMAAFTGIINPMYLEDQIDEIRKVAISVELLHSGHLIHDDLIDNDISRRGKPTFHTQLKNEISSVYKNLTIPKKAEMIKLYGRDMSILGGSLGYFLGLNVLKASKFPDNLKIIALNEYTEAMDFLMRGQIIEEYMEYHNITQSLEQYLHIAEMQRARVFEKSTRIGAILAKGNMHYQIKPLSEAMIKMGLAFSIRDDILDVEKDIENKKKKFIYILAFQNTDEEQSKVLNDIYKKTKLTKTDIKNVETIFTETNALIIAEHFSKNFVEQAKATLKEIYPDLNKDQKKFFYEFSDFIYMRNF